MAGRHPHPVPRKEGALPGSAGCADARNRRHPRRPNDPSGTVGVVAARAAAGESFLLVVAAEGTRSRATHWKSGFYRIATAACVPITMGFVDGPTRTAGFGPTFLPSDDIAADMDLIRAFYADKRGVHLANRTEPRLREELSSPLDLP